jgi:hypothetical protein
MNLLRVRRTYFHVIERGFALEEWLVQLRQCVDALEAEFLDTLAESGNTARGAIS